MSLTWKKILICELLTVRTANTNCYHSKIIKLSTLLLQRTKQYLVQPELDLSGSLRMACRYQLYILRAQRQKTHNNDLKRIQGKHFQFSGKWKRIKWLFHVYTLSFIILPCQQFLHWASSQSPSTSLYVPFGHPYSVAAVVPLGQQYPRGQVP